MSFARIVSVLFLVAQGLLMLVVAYKVNERMIKNYENEGKDVGCSGVIIIFLTLTLTAGNITWMVYQYIWYKECGSNSTMMSITLAACVFFYVIVFFRTREDASMLTSSIVVSYSLYLQWSALASKPDIVCNPFINSNTNTTMQIIAGLSFTFMSLAIISSTTKSEDKSNLTTKMNGHLMENEEGKGGVVDEELEPLEKKNGKVVT